MKRSILLALLFLGAAAAPVASQVSDSTATRDTALERRVAEIASNLRCPVCQGLSINDSPSELAQDMKRVVRDQVVAGKTRAQIESSFVQSYGEWVLLKPPAHGANLMVWFGPFLLLLGGGVVLYVAVRRWVRRGSEQLAAAPTGSAAELAERREVLRHSLVELQADFDQGKVTEADYHKLKARDEAELAAVKAALKVTKPERVGARSAAPAAKGPRRVQRAAGWIAGSVVFGAVAVLALRGSVAPREEGETMTGIRLGDGSSTEPAENPRLVELEAQIARDSNNHAALIEAGHLYLQQQRLQAAADVSMKAVRMRPQAKESAEAFAHLGMILWGANEMEHGLQAIEQSLMLSPDFPEALLYKGIILFAGANGKNDPRGAISAWERYLEVAPPGAETARVRGMLEMAREQARQ